MTVDMSAFNNRNQGVNQAFTNLIESQRTNEQARTQQQQFNANKQLQDQQMVGQLLQHFAGIQDPGAREQFRGAIKDRFGIDIPDAPPPPPPSSKELTDNAAQDLNRSVIQQGSDPTTLAFGQSMNAPSTSMMNAPLTIRGDWSFDKPAGPDAYGLGVGDTVPPVDLPTGGEKLAAILTARAAGGHPVSKDELEALRTKLMAGDQGLADTTAINDKRAPSWKESNLKLPELQSKIGLQGAQSFQARGAGTHSFAEAKRTGQLPIPPITAAPSSQPSYPHVLAKGSHSIGSYDGKKWYDVATGAPIN